MKSSNVQKFFLILVLSVATLHNADAACVSKEWVQYKEEKCIRVLDSLTSHSNALLTCQEQNSTLLSINSVEEQKFIDHLLFSDLGTLDNVWLGAIRVNSTTFQWTDGSPWTFDNWKEGSPSDVEENECVQMVPKGGRQGSMDVDTFDLSPSGLWSDVACGRRNLVVCQRKPTFSLDELTALFFQYRQASEAIIMELVVKLTKADTEILDLQTKLSGAENELKDLDIKTGKQLEEANSKILQASQDIQDLEKNPVPLGFVYTQLSGQPEPSVIWPTVGWTQVTKDYAGLFFRAEGGNSSSFGQVQNDQSPRLSRVVYSGRTDGDKSPQDINVPERGASEFIYVGSDALFSGSPWGEWKEFMSFHNSGGEVRPKNQAIRLWKRTA